MGLRYLNTERSQPPLYVHPAANLTSLCATSSWGNSCYHRVAVLFSHNPSSGSFHIQESRLLPLLLLLRPLLCRTPPPAHLLYPSLTEREEVAALCWAPSRLSARAIWRRPRPPTAASPSSDSAHTTTCPRLGNCHYGNTPGPLALHCGLAPDWFTLLLLEMWKGITNKKNIQVPF